MSIGESLRTVLTGATSVSSIVSTRVHQNTVPQGKEYPRLWYERQSEERETNLDGSFTGVREARFDVECHAETVDGALDLAEAVKGVLDATSGAFGTNTAQWVKVEDHDDDYFPKAIGSDEGVSSANLSVAIWHTT